MAKQNLLKNTCETTQEQFDYCVDCLVKTKTLEDLRSDQRIIESQIHSCLAKLTDTSQHIDNVSLDNLNMMLRHTEKAIHIKIYH